MTSSSQTLSATGQGPAGGAPAIPPVVTDALARMRYGDIRLTIHEGRLVQVDVTERTRLASPER